MSCYLAQLHRDALLHISGPDTLTFLQGQTTCDTSQVDAQNARLGAYCTPQGRVVCDFLLSRLGEEHYALRLRRDIRQGSAATFGKYIVFSKADLAAERDDWHVAACWGPDAAACLREVFGSAPEGHLGCSSGEGFQLVQVDDAGQQFECYVDSASRGDLLEALQQAATQSEEGAWESLQLASGIARIEAATVEEFVPQMLNFDLTGHVSFSKGCYTGQEVVARLHYRGTPKRRLYLCHWAGTEAAAANTALYRQGHSQSVGNVVNSVLMDGQLSALVTSTAEGVEQGLHLGAEDGPALSLGTLPYDL